MKRKKRGGDSAWECQKGQEGERVSKEERCLWPMGFQVSKSENCCHHPPFPLQSTRHIRMKLAPLSPRSLKDLDQRCRISLFCHRNVLIRDAGFQGAVFFVFRGCHVTWRWVSQILPRPPHYWVSEISNQKKKKKNPPTPGCIPGPLSLETG